MLTHEPNNFIMQEAVNWYPKLKAAFKVYQLVFHSCPSIDIVRHSISCLSAPLTLEQLASVTANQDGLIRITLFLSG